MSRILDQSFGTIHFFGQESFTKKVLLVIEDGNDWLRRLT
jgi:hypothetical protein